MRFKWQKTTNLVHPFNLLHIWEVDLWTEWQHVMQELKTIKTVQNSWPPAELWVNCFEIFVILLLLLGNSEALQSDLCRRGAAATELNSAMGNCQPQNLFSKPQEHICNNEQQPLPHDTHAHSRSILCPHMVVLVTASALLCTHLTDVYESSSFGIQIRSTAVLQFWNRKRWYLKKKKGKTERSRCLSVLKYWSLPTPRFPPHRPTWTHWITFLRVEVVQTNSPWHWTLAGSKYGAELAIKIPWTNRNKSAHSSARNRIFHALPCIIMPP